MKTKKNRKMEKFYFNHSDGITNKDIVTFIDLFKNELARNPPNLLNLTSRFFIGPKSEQATLTVLTRIKDVILKSEYFSAFKSICDQELKLSFFENDNESPNFNAAYNYAIIFTNNELFQNHEANFVYFFYQWNSSKIPTSFVKLFETFLDFLGKPKELLLKEKSIFSYHFSQIEESTHTYLGSLCMKMIKIQPHFEYVYSFIRCLARILNDLFSNNDINELFINENQNEKTGSNSLYNFLTNQEFGIPIHCYLLLLSCLIKNFPDKCEVLIEKINQMLYNDPTSTEKCFGYTSLSRVVLISNNIIKCAKNTIYYMLRDYDSQNPLLPSSLLNLYKICIKRSKSLNLSDELNSLLYNAVKTLSWHSAVKLLITPDIIESYPELFNNLIDFSQDPSDYGFVTRCVKAIAKTVKSAEYLLNAIIEDAKQNKINRSMRNYKSLFEPLFLLQPKLINHAFEYFNNLDRFIAVWLRFESLLTISCSKWPKTISIIDDLNFAINCINWDIRYASFRVFSKAHGKYENIPTEFCLNLKILLFCDSSKHTFSIDDSFSLFLDSLSTENKKIQSILFNLIEIFCYHMSSSFVTSHRQITFSLAEKLLKKFPNIEEQNLFNSIISLLYDGSMTFRYFVRDKINQIIHDHPNTESKFKLHQINWNEIFEYTQNSNKTLNKDNELILLINKIKENSFDAIQELQILLEDKQNIFSQETLLEQSQIFFEFYLNTKNVGVSYRSQNIFVALCNKIEKNELAKKLTIWKSSLLNILKNFDMETMRRSASLPDVALSLIRLEPPSISVLNDNDTSNIEIATALVDMVCRTSIETEAVNSLNVIRSVIKDKVTSKVEDILYPLGIKAIFQSSLKFAGWDFVAASNLCFASIMHKLFKRSSTTLNIIQFFQKFADAKQLLLDALQSHITHANYLALTTLSLFKKTTGHEESFIPYVSRFLLSKSSRIRRLAANSLISITPQDKLINLYKTCLYYINKSRFSKDTNLIPEESYFTLNKEINSNTFHGLLITVSEIIQELSPEELTSNLYSTFPQINIELVPPITLAEINIIYQFLHLSDQISSIKLGNFYFDQVSLIIIQGKLNEDLFDSFTNSQLVALLTKLQNKSVKIENLDKFILQKILNNSSDQNLTISSLVLKLSLDYLVKNNIHFNSSKLLNNTLNNDIQAYLIHELDDEGIKQNIDLFISHCFDKNDTDTSAKIAISEKIESILSLTSNGLIVALCLLIDDVPIVRTNTSLGVSNYLKIDNLCEITLFEILIGHLTSEQLLFLSNKWIELIKSKIGNDNHGEPLTVLVDEFFVLRRTFSKLKIEFDFCKYSNSNISSMRKPFVQDAEAALISMY